MNLFSMLTVVFIVLKLTDVIDWSWWLVVSPTLFTITMFIVIIVIAAISETRRDKRFDDWKR